MIGTWTLRDTLPYSMSLHNYRPKCKHLVIGSFGSLGQGLESFFGFLRAGTSG